jgi:hypothetical protein
MGAVLRLRTGGEALSCASMRAWKDVQPPPCAWRSRCLLSIACYMRAVFLLLTAVCNRTTSAPVLSQQSPNFGTYRTTYQQHDCIHKKTYEHATGICHVRTRVGSANFCGIIPCRSGVITRNKQLCVSGAAFNVVLSGCRLPVAGIAQLLSADERVALPLTKVARKHLVFILTTTCSRKLGRFLCSSKLRSMASSTIS